MVEFSKDNIKVLSVVSIVAVIFGVFLVAVSVLQGTDVIGNVLASIVVIGVGVYQNINASKIKKRYGNIFDESREITVREIAALAGVTEKQVVKDLKACVSRRGGRRRINVDATITVDNN